MNVSSCHISMKIEGQVRWVLKEGRTRAVYARREEWQAILDEKGICRKEKNQSVSNPSHFARF